MQPSFDNKIFRAIATGCFLLLSYTALPQKRDSTDTQDVPAAKAFIHNIFQQVVDAVTISKKDSSVKAVLLNAKSESLFRRHEGKIIRHIFTRELGFEKTLSDTSRRISRLGTGILNALHKNTREWVIRDNLFIRENSVLNPYIVADNERYLRTLEFIQDARILVQPIRGISDSVDILVITKDLFSITGGLDVNGIKRVRAGIAETNLLGMGQKIQYTTLIDKDRKPAFGYELKYTKNSIKNTFVNASVGYTVINGSRNDGSENEKAFFVRMERPLVSHFSRLAGSMEISSNHSDNLYRKPDSLFYQYRFNLYDGWVGYNLGVTKLLLSKDKIRDRSFFAIRYLNNYFTRMPFQVAGKYNTLFNSREALLAEFTLFRQDFYKTNYIYGFGNTEDVPYGINIAVTGGWYKQLYLERLYAGVNANQYVVTPNGQFIQYFLRTGGFFKSNSLQDASILTGGNYFSKIFLYRNLKVREFIRFSYTRQFNRLTFEPLRIDNLYGLQSFSSDSIRGTQRLSIYAETFAFSKYKLFGFQMAPFLFTDFSLLSPEKDKLFKSGLYTGVGGGLRTRNENLVFGTIELRLIYFPKRSERSNSLNVSFRSNIRFRYNTRYVKAPDIIQLNSGEADVF